MKKITSTIKQEMLFLDDSYERLKLLKDKYKDAFSIDNFDIKL